jgi:RNase P subunit RPR2
MGHFEMYRPGEYAICDKCEKPKPLAESYSVMVDGQAVIWLCKECK